MIRYPFDAATVTAEIAAVDAKWATKAAKRTLDFITAGRFEDSSPIWSKAKPAFMRLQMNKCVFCERQFENPDYGTIEFDLEHFRPKSNVAVWPDPGRHTHLTYDHPTGLAAPSGYYWLAYDLQNYAASCKVCNTTFKLNYFPVGKNRGAVSSSVAALAGEEPYLCYPIGTVDVDPQTLMTFVATTAVPASGSVAEARRGQVMIDFFGLNQRDILHRERARMIAILGAALRAVSDGVGTTTDQRVIQRMREPLVPHAACVRAFSKLWQSDPVTAKRAYDLCREYGFSEPGEAPPAI
ncbi:hypothetical protein [Phenylobacterium sp.]|jgi:hypothetical protein|uniref:hypothetical protein n=1 Tax=Phenylobacterium sp. TaxID=1871053 RepID=UPI0037C961DC